MTSHDPQRHSHRPNAQSKSALEWQTSVWEGQPMPADRSPWVERAYTWIDMHRRLFRFICARAGVDPDDAIQDVAVKLLDPETELPDSKCGKDVEAWLKRTVKNRATDEHRQAMRRRAVSTSSDDAPVIIASDLGPQEQLARREFTAAVHAAIETLPEAQRKTAADMLEHYASCEKSNSRPRDAGGTTSGQRMRRLRTRKKLQQLLSAHGILLGQRVA